MVKSKKVDDGSKDGAMGYYCECGKCSTTGSRNVMFSKELAENVEEIHLQRIEIEKEHIGKLNLLGRKEARLVGIGWIQQQKDGKWIEMDLNGDLHEIKNGTVMVDELIGKVDASGEIQWLPGGPNI